MDIRTKLIFALVAVSLGSMLLLGLIVSSGADDFVRDGTLDQLEFRAWLLRTSLILAAFAIVAGLGLGLRLALPIHDLAEAANRIRKGEMHARADVAREDEIGLLARTFNEMACEIEDQILLLRDFRKFFDVSIDLMCIAGTDGYFKRCNPAFLKTLGWSEEELLASPFFEFTHPDDIEGVREVVGSLAAGNPLHAFTSRMARKDGGYVRLNWTSYPDDGVLYSIGHVIGESPAA